MNSALKLFAVFTLFGLFVSCSSGSEKNTDESSAKNQNTPAASDLSPWQENHGIGPITKEIPLNPIDKSLAASGQKIFEMKCLACHKMDERYVGPPIRDITRKRTPEFIMNMILNPDEMVKKHPEVQKLLADYLTPMTYQNVSESDARAILEYLRVVATEKKAAN